MNFFGKKRTYFRGLVKKPRKAEPESNLERLRRKYVLFCESIAVSPEVSAREFTYLCANDSVEKLSIADQDGIAVLIVSTKEVVLRDPHTSLLHDVGKMLIVMRRKPNAEMYFYNQGGIVTTGNGFEAHHPHVRSDGIICSNYRDIMCQQLAGGQVLSAIEQALDALQTYGPGTPYGHITAWPVIPPEEEKNA